MAYIALQEKFFCVKNRLPQPAAALSITNMMNPNLFFFFFISVEAAHRRLTRRPPELGGGVAATELEQEIRKYGLLRKKKVRRKSEEERRGDKVGHEEEAGRVESARDQCAEDGVQHASRWISRRGPAKLACSSQVPSRYSPPPSFPSHPSPSPHGKFRMENSERRQTFLPLSFFLPSQSVENTFAPGRLGARSVGKVRVVAWRRRGVRGGSS